MTKTAPDLTRPDSPLSPSAPGVAGSGGSSPAVGMPWRASPVADVLAALGTTQEGLGTAEARSRLATVGPNVLPRARPDGPLQLLWRQIGRVPSEGYVVAHDGHRFTVEAMDGRRVARVRIERVDNSDADSPS